MTPARACPSEELTEVLCGAAMQLDLTEWAVLEGGSCQCSEEHASVADRVAGLTEAKSGHLHESRSLTSLKSGASSNSASAKASEDAAR
jgi:hypothetical protein